VLLVEPPKPYWPLLKDTVMPPIGLACLAAYLRENGIEVSILDCPASGLSWNDLKHRLGQDQPDVVGVSAIACHFEIALRAVRLAKEVLPDVFTVAGGAHFTFSADETLLSCPELDLVVIGEGEVTLFELVRELGKEHPDLSRVNGLAFRRGSSVVRTPPRGLISNIDELPLPAWDLLPMDKYRLAVLGDRVTMTVSSRGCSIGCTFCSEAAFWGNAWRPRSARKVVDEMQLLKDKYGKSIVWFGDDTFNLNRQRNLQFCQELEERGLDMKWSFEGRADLILRDRDLLDRMVDAGLHWVLVGVEFASDDELERHRKKLSIDQIRGAFHVLKKRDIVTQAMFVIGTRGETRQSVIEKVEFAKSLDPDFAIFSPLTPFPGTAIWEEAKRNGWLETTDFSKYDFAHGVMSTGSLSAAEVSELMSECYARFYARPLKILRGVLSPNEFRRGLSTYFLSFFKFGT